MKNFPTDKMWFRWLLVVGWMAVIFAFSNQAHSGELTEQYLHSWNIAVRKAAHMTEYGILLVLVRWALLLSMRSGWPISAASLLICIMYAGSDEWHQSFVPGRSAQVSDVLVDGSGALLSMLVCHYLWRRKCKPVN